MFTRDKVIENCRNTDEWDTRLGYPGGGTDTKERETGTFLEKREQAGLGLAGAR